MNSKQKKFDIFFSLQTNIEGENKKFPMKWVLTSISAWLPINLTSPSLIVERQMAKKLFFFHTSARFGVLVPATI